MNKAKEFNAERLRLNEIVLKYSDKEIKRFLSLDNQVYRADQLSAATKEMLGLVASLVLRCDDCIKYHLGQCYEAGVTIEQVEEVLSVGLIVGGSITIPHIRRAFEFWEELSQE
ncbi:MAG: carboxymuconolactone decarboxylase family protein [Candidatus Cloacimonadales bacterium]